MENGLVCLNTPYKLLKVYSPKAMAASYTSNVLYFRPVSWVGDPNSSLRDLSGTKSNPSHMGWQGKDKPGTFLEIFGYVQDSSRKWKTVYLRLPRYATFVLRFHEEIDNNTEASIENLLNPIQMERSPSNPHLLILRGPEISPLDFTSEDEFGTAVSWAECYQDPYGELVSFWRAKHLQPYAWMVIQNYRPIPQITTCDLNIQVSEANIYPLDRIRKTDAALHAAVESQHLSPRLFFWDIETFASRKGEVPSADRGGIVSS